MVRLLRLLLGVYIACFLLQALPACADSASKASDPVDAATSTQVNSDQGKSGQSASEPRDMDSERATRTLMKELSDPSRKKDALGLVAELLGVTSGLMLITGAILAACVKKWGLVKLMLGVGVAGGILAVAAPGLINIANSEALGMGFAVIYLLMYIGVFFLPTILALKDNTAKKWIILLINAAGFVVPGAGLVALYLALKDKPEASNAVSA